MPDCRDCRQAFDSGNFVIFMTRSIRDTVGFMFLDRKSMRSDEETKSLRGVY